MGKGAIAIGFVFILFGIWLLFQVPTSFLLIYPIGIIAIGLALIILWREEGKIEERKDLKPKRKSK